MKANYGDCFADYARNSAFFRLKIHKTRAYPQLSTGFIAGWVWFLALNGLWLVVLWLRRRMRLPRGAASGQERMMCSPPYNGPR